jgi:3-oxoadipate enol-lactonase
MRFTIEMFARDLAELLDHLGWETSALAGCSLGGCVAQAFAMKCPARLLALGLIDTTAWYGPDAASNWRDRADRARTSGLAGMVEFQVSRWFSDEFRRHHPAVVQNISSIFMNNDIGCYGASCIMLGEVDLRPFQGAIRVPTVVVVGQEDYATPVAMSQQLHASIGGSTLSVLPRVRHLTPVEAPQDIAAHLMRLLDNVVR